MPHASQAIVMGKHPHEDPHLRELILLREASPCGIAIAWDSLASALVVVDLKSKDNDIIELLFECKRRFPFIQ